jgi:hypothetical protein
MIGQFVLQRILLTDFLLGYSTEGYIVLNCGWGIAKGYWGGYNLS